LDRRLGCPVQLAAEVAEWERKELRQNKLTIFFLPGGRME
jgi:hypothetical protein